MGIGQKQNQVFIIDFGLAKVYMDSRNLHLPYREHKLGMGSARYSSIHTHLGVGKLPLICQ
jgi:hypothetical protein